MANASYIQDAFIGGEKSQLAQGRITDRDYRTWMNVCVNGHPTEAGGWVRRSGTMYAGHTRLGNKGRVYRFDFAASTPYTMEFTDGIIRFRSGTQLATSNDSQTVTSISGDSPAVIGTLTTNGWSTGNTVIFSGLGTGAPVLQNRQFTITVIDTTHFTLADPITGAPVNGNALGAAFSSGTVSRVQELASPYFGGIWSELRAVQAELTAVLLHGTIRPQILTAVPASGTNNATFSLTGLTFLDGPYFDPFTNGVQVSPGSLSGNVILTLQFPAWTATQAYQTGSFVTSAGISYKSLIDDNIGNTPASSPAAWVVVSAGAAVNNGRGFVGTDIGRLVRLFSEPPLWNATTSYATGNIVSYNPSGAPGASTYWTVLSGGAGNIPGNDTTHWQLTPANAAVWTWGRITALQNQISQLNGTPIGNLNQSGSLAAAFDGLTVQPAAVAATQFQIVNITSGLVNISQTLSIDGYVGKNFSTPQQVQSVSVFGSQDSGLMQAFGVTNGIPNVSSTPVTISNIVMTVNLRAKQTTPGSPSDGTLLATTGNIAPPQTPLPGLFGNISELTAPVTLISNDQVTAWNFVWVELIVSATFNGTNIPVPDFGIFASVAEMQLFNPNGNSGAAITVAILGPPLLYSNPIINWRLGAYSDTTTWPTNGTYHEGRIWLAGAVGNRFDASVSNGLVGTTLNMAPTDQNGVVGAANGITGIINSDGVNPIFWMTPDLQGVIVGTQAGEWLISAPSSGPISATNVFVHRATKIGCAFIEPRKTDHTNVFVQRYTKKVMEYFTDVFSGKFAAPNLAKDTMHITKPFVAELAYTQANIPIVWGRNLDGSWWGTTYKRDTLATSTGPTINGWHRHVLGSGRLVQSIAAGPSVGGTLDALSMVTLDSASGVYHVEVMTDAVDEGNTLLQATYLDDAVNPTSVTSSPIAPAPYGGLTLNGLWHLNGKIATAWLGGLDCGDYMVVNGSITVPYGDGISAGTASGLFTAVYAATLSLSQMLVGFTFTSQGQIVRPATPAESGARNGPAVGKVRRNHKIAAMFEGTVGVSVGTTFSKVDPVKFRQPNDIALRVNQQFTGVYKDTLTDTFSFDGMVCWQVTRPYPCNIANLGGFIETSDE